MKTTVIYAPHPDDEALYLGQYGRFARAQGNRMILAAASDGDGSGAKPADWTTKALVNVRVAEQTSSWFEIAGPNGLIHRLGYADSETATVLAEVRAGVCAFAEAMERAYTTSTGDTVEHYVAGGYLTGTGGQSKYHQAVANGVKDAGVNVARFAREPGVAGNGTSYKPLAGSGDLKALVTVDDVYSGFGHISVPTVFKAWRDSGYESRIYP